MNCFFKTNKEWETTKRINTCPFRSHYIPFNLNEKPKFVHKIIDKYSSSLLTSLNGDWEFVSHDSIQDIQYIDEKLPHRIDVPSCVQCRGYDYFQYINITYPFPFNPPYVPKDNPVFHYRKGFRISDIKNLFLVFEGVDSAFYVFINNQFVGFSQISHSKSEFNITKFVHVGENIIDVVVLKWCASSYLEDQDKFRFSGIFRDVYLLNRPNEFIWDYKVEAIHENNEWFIKFENHSSCELDIEFENHITHVLINTFVKIPIKNPIIWSNENPYLYDLIIRSKSEQIFERVGLRDISIKNKVFLLNNKPIKLKGVNRHETNPHNGATVSIEDTYKDLIIIKDLNCNAIRTSHYPDIPEFYELCDILGIYVVDEADLETHGATQEGYSLQKWQDFANSGLYDDAALDREMSLYERDKNRTCVIIWSLGNESNWGTMFYSGADYIHNHDNRPIHYEGIFNLVDKTDYHTTRIDINSMMYPSFDVIKERYLDDEKETRPLMLCEYTHAMGNSCGDVKDYWDFINKHESIIGAFVWEFCDHAVIVNGQLKYGSDFPEHQNDKNFCVDGLVTPYRELKSSAYEVKAVYENAKKPRKMFKKLNINQEKSDIFNETDVFLEPIELSITRANIDNEMRDLNDYNAIRNANKKVVNKSNGIKQTTYFTSEKEKIITITEKHEHINNILKIELSYLRNPKFNFQRVGIKFTLNSNFSNCTYFGFGPDESYCDKYIHTKLKKYEFDVLNCKCPYLKPQEYGSHYYCSFVKFKNLIICAEKPFSFSALPYSENQLLTTSHNYELNQNGNVYVNLNVSMAGVGSHSCGPILSKKYCVPKKGTNIFYFKLTK